MSVLLAALLGAARAEDAPRAWEALHDGRLVESVDGTPGVAVSFYEEALAGLTPDDPLRGRTLVALGSLRWQDGDVEGASRALREATRFAGARADAEALLARIEMDTRRVRSLPVRVGFEGGTGGFVRAGEGWDRGALEVHPEGSGAVLAWNTVVRPGDPDRIALALDRAVRLRRVALRVRSEGSDALLRVRVTDGGGGVWAETEVDATPDGWSEVVLSAPGAGRPQARLIEIIDATPLAPPGSGRNLIVLDDLELEGWP